MKRNRQCATFNSLNKLARQECPFTHVHCLKSGYSEIQDGMASVDNSMVKDSIIEKHLPIDNIGILGHVGLLLMRLYVGISMMSAGMDKIPLPPWMTEQVEAISWMPMPEVMAWSACFSEFAGGLLIALGLLTRPAAFFLAITMAVAAFASQKVGIFTEIHVTQGYLWSYVLLLTIGAGRISLDHLFKSWGKWIGIGLTIILAGYSLMQGKAEPEPDMTEDLRIESLSVPGMFNEWNPATDTMTALGDSVYQLERSLPAGLVEFKVAANGSWDVNMGAIEQGAPGFPMTVQGTLDDGGNTENIKAFIPRKGDYTFTLDLKSMQLRVDSL